MSGDIVLRLVQPGSSEQWEKRGRAMSVGIGIGEELSDASKSTAEARERSRARARSRSKAADGGVRSTRTWALDSENWIFAGLNSKQRGELAEMMFMVKATQKGFATAKPYGDSRRYDFIVDVGRSL
jgi:hypothetical protein